MLVLGSAVPLGDPVLVEELSVGSGVPVGVDAVAEPLGLDAVVGTGPSQKKVTSWVKVSPPPTVTLCMCPLAPSTCWPGGRPDTR